MSRNLLWANLAGERISRAIRQHDRLQKAYRRMQREDDRILEANGMQFPVPMPQSFTELEAVFKDQLYFFVVAVRQAIKAGWVLQGRGESIPFVTQEALLRAWRNYEEHWDALARNTNLKVVEEWLAVSEDAEPGLSYGGRVGKKPRLTTVSGVKLKRLMKDLHATRQAVNEVSEREWSYCYITAAEAADILDMTPEEFEALPVKPTHLDFGDFLDEAHSGVKYFRDWVEAWRDDRLIPPGWEPYLN